MGLSAKGTRAGVEADRLLGGMEYGWMDLNSEGLGERGLVIAREVGT